MRIAVIGAGAMGSIYGGHLSLKNEVYLVDTNAAKRIISIDVQGITGKRRSFTSMPYSKVQFFAIQTPGFMELVPDSELFLRFANGFEATFEFRGNVDIGLIGRIISEYVLV